MTKVCKLPRVLALVKAIHRGFTDIFFECAECVGDKEVKGSIDHRT